MKKQIKTYLSKITGFRLNLLFKASPQKAVEKAFKLFATPRKGGVGAEQKDFLDPAKAEILTVRNLKLQTYFWPNSGKTVLLLHGWESNTARWQDFIFQLQEKSYAILSLDAPAHGYSEGRLFTVPLYAEAVAGLLKKYQPQFVVGHSVGASTLIFQQHKFSTSPLEKMVLLAPPAKMTTLMAGFQKQLGLKYPLMKALDTYFKEKFGYDFNEFSMLNFIKGFHLDALFVHDKDDSIANWKESEILVENWENARLFITKGEGHPLKNKAINETIISFLSGN